MKIQSIHVLLFQRLALSDPTFDPFAYMKKVSQLPTNKAKIDFVYEEINKHQLFPKVIKDAKSDFVSEEHRQNGHRHLESGHFFSALEDYTRSVATAQTKTALGLAYSDRSASLCKLGLHKCAITDIERAMEIGPKHVKSRLRLRLNKAKRQLRSVEPYFEEIPKFRNSEKNAMIQSASDCIKIKNVDNFGRQIIASRDIQIGEILAIEAPYAAIVTIDRLIHCTNCLELCYNPIACDNCTLVLFCSTYCKDKAQGYHQYECPILLTLHEMALESALVALRIAILARDEYELLDFAQSASMDDYYCSDRYREVHNLNSSPEFAEDELHCFLTTVTASVLMYLLKRCTHFFMGDNSIEDAFKEVIMRQLLNASSNSAKISEYTRNLTTQTYERQYFAEGLYPFFALFNHSCCNNVTRSFHGSTMVLHALNSIKKGEQCSVNYGCHYGTTPKFIRQISLSTNYFFDCKCRACEGNWKPDCVNSQLAMKNSAIDVQKRLGFLADVNFARHFLKKLVQLLKKCEKNEPVGRALLVKTKIIQCHEILGNKRRI